MPMTSKQMVKFLKKNGCKELRHKNSSHKIMYSPITNQSFPVPMHNKDLGKGLEQIILKQAGLK